MPAGSVEALSAAVSGGADAVYLGGKRFGARSFASNFSDDELAGAISYLHDKDVKGYVTVNTLVKDSEMDEALQFIAMLEDMGADAVIIQDKGLLEELQDFKIPLHASTQMGLHNAEGLEWARGKGISRAILARELSIEEIEDVSSRSSMELEVFVHGALCYSVSGQCLFSSMLGGRSGNRGSCAQPCRKVYSSSQGKGYMLSTADMECLDLLPRLRDAGVASVKVEGRMRSPLYVHLVARAYSRALRGDEDSVSERDRELIRTAFNRGHSMGHMEKREVRQTSFADNRGLPLGEMTFKDSRLVHRSGSRKLHPGDGITLYGRGKAGGFKVTDADDIIVPFALADGTYDAYRSSDWEFASILASIPALVMDGKAPARRSLESTAKGIKRRPVRGELSVYLSSLRTLEAVIGLCDRVYFEDNRHLAEATAICADAGVEVVAIMPRFTPRMPEMPELPLMVHDPGQASAFAGRRIYGSHHLNLFNSSNPVEMFQQTISPELSAAEVSMLTSGFRGRLEMMVFGRTELMVARDPTLEEGSLMDGKGYRFPINKDRGGMVRILNSADTVLLEHLDDLDAMGIESHGIDLRRRPADLSRSVMEIFSQRDLDRRRELRKACGKVTYGHFNRGV